MQINTSVSKHGSSIAMLSITLPTTQIGLVIRFYDRVRVFLSRSKPDRGTEQKTKNPCPVGAVNK